MTDGIVYEAVLFQCPCVHIYVVPPPTGRDFRTDSWGLSQPIFTGRLRVIEILCGQSSSLEIRIEDQESGELFAAAPYIAEYAVERSQDSSRYFQIRVVNEKQVAYLGLGFEDRDASFDFQVALSDYLKRGKAQKPAVSYATLPMITPDPDADVQHIGTMPLIPPPPQVSSPRRLRRDPIVPSTEEDDFGEFQ